MKKTRRYATPQEDFWAGEFGNQYIGRNDGTDLLASNVSFFARALRRAGKISSCLEMGANIGMNLRALRVLYPEMGMKGAEINAEAARLLVESIGEGNVFQGSILEFPATETEDLVLIKGVLIHVNPEVLEGVYEKLYRASRRLILLCEYYNPSPVVVAYRGHAERLFKRDFAGEMLDRYPDLRLLDYGFVYHRDPGFPQDDITWFLMEKGR